MVLEEECDKDKAWLEGEGVSKEEIDMLFKP